MIGAVVFIIVFVLFLLIALAGIALPPGDWFSEYFSDLLQSDYATLAEGVINGVIIGVIVWVIFSISRMVYNRMQAPKETVVIVEKAIKADEPVRSSASVIEIEGIGQTYAKKLNAVGVKTTDELLEAGATKQERKELAEKTGISETIILEWVNMADLFRIKGIGEEYSDLLKEAGVSTVVELARRNPENLHETIVGVNEAKRLVRRPPSLNQIKDWVEQAKKLPRKVEY